MAQTQYPARRIVVGVDGSQSSKEALQWAVRQAELTGSSIEAVIAWHYPVMMGAYGYGPISEVGLGDFAETAAKTLAEAIADAVDPATNVSIATSVLEGNPSQVLLKASANAGLLVVGCRGLGGFSSALLGSVSQHCAQYATCPILIVHSPHTG